MISETHHRLQTAFVVALVTGLAALAAATTALAGRAADVPAWEKALMARSDTLNRYYGLGTYAGTGIRRHTAFRGPVVVDCRGSMSVGPPSPPRGRCTVSGALSDRGRFADNELLGYNPHTRIFRGTKGTIEMRVYLERGHWEIVEGTNAYAGLRGRGWERSSGRCRSPGCVISLTMVGTVEGRESELPAWKQAMIARSDALNRHYRLGAYAER
jgi:hypothetical protein